MHFISFFFFLLHVSIDTMAKMCVRCNGIVYCDGVTLLCCYCNNVCF